MKTTLFAIMALFLLMQGCSSPGNPEKDNLPQSGQLARVLIITTGISEQTENLPQGIVVAMQALNKAGAIVTLQPRDILYKLKELRKYNMIILSTYENYHDADRRYSLSYMSDEEIRNINSFVAEGGVLISGENVGRNYSDGTDRVIVFQKLMPENWDLSSCFGYSFSERNVTSYKLAGAIPGAFKWETTPAVLSGELPELWALIPDSCVSEKSKALAYWVLGDDSIPAITENYYKKGIAYHLAYSAFLQPENGGGYWSARQIGMFYDYVIARYNQLNGIEISLNPWPSGYDYAFCVSFNAEGDLGQYERCLDYLKKEKITPLIFVNGNVKKGISDYLLSSGVPLASNGFSYGEFADLNYPQSVDDILRNEDYWRTEFSGFRFPYTRPAYWGLLALDEHNYSFESSIGANNIDFFHGSVVPYNIVISREGFYKSTGILEIAPTYHDDYFFLSFLKDTTAVDSLALRRNVRVYTSYLENFCERAVKPYAGLMVFLGHPQYVGYNDVTMESLKQLIAKVKRENAWIASVQQVVDFRKSLTKMQFVVNKERNTRKITVITPDGQTIHDVCVNVKGKIKKAEALKGKVRIVEGKNMTKLIFDAMDKQVISYTI